jgi:hypothetical protein
LATLEQQDFALAGDDDDLVLNAVSRVRLVQFTKDTEEPMGITLKVGNAALAPGSGQMAREYYLYTYSTLPPKSQVFIQ